MGFSHLNKLETTHVSQFRVVDSVTRGDGVHIPIIEGAASRSDVKSQKGYRYKRGFWEQMIGNPTLQQRISERDMLGMIEHPLDDSDYMRTPLDKASHVVLKAWMNEDTHDPWIQCGLLNNPAGNAIKALIDVGFKPGCSTRALAGECLQDSISPYWDANNFVVLTWDLVRSPNFEDIRLDKVSDSLMELPVFKETMQMYQLRDSVDECYDKAKLAKDMQQVADHLRSIAERLMRS